MIRRQTSQTRQKRVGNTTARLALIGRSQAHPAASRHAECPAPHGHRNQAGQMSRNGRERSLPWAGRCLPGYSWAGTRGGATDDSSARTT